MPEACLRFVKSFRNAQNFPRFWRCFARNTRLFAAPKFVMREFGDQKDNVVTTAKLCIASNPTEELPARLIHPHSPLNLRGLW
jgi:hypothetical protein